MASVMETSCKFDFVAWILANFFESRAHLQLGNRWGLAEFEAELILTQHFLRLLNFEADCSEQIVARSANS